MDTELYQLHQEYGKHTGVDTGCTSSPSDRQAAGRKLYYCRACQGFYILDGARQLRVAAGRHVTPHNMIALDKEWRTFLNHIGGHHDGPKAYPYAG
jgi:hypothetical protein